MRNLHDSEDHRYPCPRAHRRDHAALSGGVDHQPPGGPERYDRPLDRPGRGDVGAAQLRPRAGVAIDSDADAGIHALCGQDQSGLLEPLLRRAVLSPDGARPAGEDPQPARGTVDRDHRRCGSLHGSRVDRAGIVCRLLARVCARHRCLSMAART